MLLEICNETPSLYVFCGFADNLSVSPAEMSKRPLPVPSQAMTWYEQVKPYRRGQIVGQ